MRRSDALVLDTSALLAYLHGEPDSEIVEASLTVGAVINVLNCAEVLGRLGDAGAEPAAVHRRLQEQGLIGGLLEVVPLTEDGAPSP